jgi:hypothetical protein
MIVTYPSRVGQIRVSKWATPEYRTQSSYGQEVRTGYKR